jgi:tRNA A37 threonylcarbamoyladenosine synthetase subunit TsaC/SUA5/YrdC
LAAGAAVVVPNPAPMTYGVVAARARAVNALKGRPLDQNVAVSLHDAGQSQRVMSIIDLPPGAVAVVPTLLARRLTVLLPWPSGAHPDWATPAIRDGYLAAFNGHWTATAVLWERFPRLYGSSANLTGEPPASSAAQAVAMFGPDCAVVDGGELDDSPGPRSASTIVRIDPAGRLSLYRTGAHDAAHGLEPGQYVRDLAATVGLPIGPAER